MATTAEKLLARMRQSKQGWTFDDLETLYEGFGFSYRDKGKHRVYTHRAYPTLIATATRHRKLAVGYIQTAIKLIDQLLEWERRGVDEVTTVQIKPPKLPYTIIVREDYATDGSRVVVAEIPELPGCMSHGETPEEATQNLEEAAELYLEALAESGQHFPAPGALGDTPLTSGTGSAEDTGVGTTRYEVETSITIELVA